MVGQAADARVSGRIGRGPTGGAKGYEAITGNPPDDMSVVWWINNHLLPEIYVERGQTYWFRVQVNE